MEFKIDIKKPIIIDDQLTKLGNDLTERLIEQETIPSDTRYLCFLIQKPH